MADQTRDRVTEFAPAKVNLTLHVTGQRDDGLHLLDSLVAFADIGDRLSVAPADDMSLSVGGPMAAGVPVGGSNLVLRAAGAMLPPGDNRAARLHLEKYLPAAAGIGGGSSDAAAAIRALTRLFGVAPPVQIEALGADIPVCLLARAARMRGIGGDVSPLARWPKLPAVLVNPRVEVATSAAFAALSRRVNAPMPERIPAMPTVAAAAGWIATQRNDLEGAARTIAPVIGDVLDDLSGTAGALLARMSGSGATCFALFESRETARTAARALAARHPDWWVGETVLA